MMMLSALFALGAVAAPLDVSERYRDCVEKVAANVEEGRAHAQRWTSEGGGAPAQHCLAVADLAAGYPKLAAVRLMDLAERNDAGDDYVRARLLAQAAGAWLEASEQARAREAIDAAFALAPDAGELYLTAAHVFAAEENWQGVIDAVTTAANAGFESADTYVLRGRARKVFGDNEGAAEDVVNALSLEPTNIDALVLRGELQQTGIVIDVFLGDRPASQ